MDVVEHSLQNDIHKVVKSGTKISRCIVDYLESSESSDIYQKPYSAFFSANILAKCFHAGLWENSIYVAKQLPGIGTTSSRQLAEAGKVHFEAILRSNPRDLERV